MKNAKTNLIIVLGSLLCSVGVYFFMIPDNLTVGGLAGFAIGLNHFIPQIPTGIIMFLCNIILFILGFLILGKAFGAKSVVSSLLISGFIYLFELVYPDFKPMTGEVLLNMLVGILISAAGVAMVINQNASTGGTDIVAMILKKFFNLDIGKGLYIADFITVVVGGMAFGKEIFMYSFFGILINSFVVDKAIAGFNTKVNMFITSTHPFEINDYIIKEINRGSTIYNALGGYSLEDRHIINTIVSRGQYIRIKNKVKEIDPKAFISISYVSEVLGEGFTYELEREEDHAI
ncbi:MAG: YitT family protein [Tissierellia bacterium]|nr:YitT family protein [Tissierellia bacterium]